jgi:hypothetical protein
MKEKHVFLARSSLPTKWMSLLLLAFCLLYGLATSQTNPAQKNALISFFKSTNGGDWIRKWDFNTDPCKDNWFGIKCAGIESNY